MEEFASVQEAQAGITKLFIKAKNRGKFIRVMRNQDPLGVLLPNNLWDSLVEDLEALSSPNYVQSILEAREASKKTDISSKKMKKLLEIE